jgi:hypothetical protein
MLSNEGWKLIRGHVADSHPRAVARPERQAPGLPRALVFGTLASLIIALMVSPGNLGAVRTDIHKG